MTTSGASDFIGYFSVKEFPNLQYPAKNRPSVFERVINQKRDHYSIGLNFRVHIVIAAQGVFSCDKGIRLISAKTLH